MANNGTYVMLIVRDDAGREQSHLLGTAGDVYGQPLSIGRAPGCDIVLKHPSVPPRVEIATSSNQHIVRRESARRPGQTERGTSYALVRPGVRLGAAELFRWRGPEPEVVAQEAEERYEPIARGAPIRIGAFWIQLVDVSEPWRAILPPEVIPVRFGPHRLRAIQAADIPADLRATEVRRLVAALDDLSGHVRALDDAGAAWCEEQVQLHFAALSQVTSPRPPLGLTRIEYTGSLEGALDRWEREWRGAEARAFHYATWDHVHRVGRWLGLLREAREHHFSFTERHDAPVRERLLEVFQGSAGALVDAHLATLEDHVSPVRPLVGLLARGVYPLALPDSAMLLYASGAGAAAERSSSPIERAFVDELGDEGARLAYGDYLEERGELARAAVIRVRSGLSLGAPVRDVFPEARPLLGPGRASARALRVPEDLVPDGSVPTARLEIDGRLHALGSRAGLAWAEDRLVVDPPAGTWGTMLTQAGGALWLSVARDQMNLRVNGRYLVERPRQPLFDGDVITLGAGRAIVRL